MEQKGRLRVCHVAYSFYETDNRVMRYAETAAARGDLVDVLSLRRSGQLRFGHINGVRIYRIQQRSINEKAQWIYLLKILWFFVRTFLVLSTYRLGRGYDVIHVHNIPDFLVFAATIPKLCGARVILDIHDVVPELYAGKFGVGERAMLFRTLLIVERLSCRFADHVIVANHLWYGKLTRRSVPAHKCTPILNYPDLTVFRPLTGRRTNPGQPFVFLYPGTLNHHQGLDIAIAAFAQARTAMPGAEFHIYGDGPTRETLSKQAATLGVRGQVKFMARVPLTEVPAIMRAADAAVVPKRADGFGDEAFSTKTLEFMACGVPVIVSRTKVDAHYFSDDVVRFFPPGQPDELAGAMLELYQQRERRAELSTAGLQCAQENSWQGHASDYLRIVDTLTGLRQPSAAR